MVLHHHLWHSQHSPTVLDQSDEQFEFLVGAYARVPAPARSSFGIVYSSSRDRYATLWSLCRSVTQLGDAANKNVQKHCALALLLCKSHISLCRFAPTPDLPVPNGGTPVDIKAVVEYSGTVEMHAYDLRRSFDNVSGTTNSGQIGSEETDLVNAANTRDGARSASAPAISVSPASRRNRRTTRRC